MNTDLRKAAQDAIKALQLAEVEMRYAGWTQTVVDNPGRLDSYDKVVKSLAVLRAALEQPNECETCARKRERLKAAGFLRNPLRENEHD